MRISCVIPTRNRPEMTCRAIAGVVAQDTPVSEIIVVDDGSTDNTVALVAARFPEVRLLKCSGLGPGLARNAGVAAASGQVIMFLDSDDVWLEGHVAGLVRTLARGYPVAYGLTRNIDRIGGGEFFIPEPGMAVEGQCLAALARWCFLVPSAMAVEKEAFVAAGGFGGGELGEDWSFFIRLAQRFSFGFCGDEPITLRHLHGGSLCNCVGGERLESLLVSVGLALAESGALPEDVSRFQALADWTRRQGDWQSIQQWYICLKEEALV
ncbi:MAG: glycosyltransferase [Desulfobulbaceae bacterium]|nr:glycosyltransferase [Desulfobulbaceae bacterium]HIJ90522.1 glycosyltransferase family 2 protein [Deltaproteobacteria bacterium]